MNTANSHAILLFDGVCNYCNRRVNFVIRNDKRDVFRFAALQSESGKKLLRENNLNENDLFSVILIENGKVYTKSKAALRILKLLGNRWSLFYALIIVPGFIRDFVYDGIANNRYKWWGKRDSCMIPSEEIKQKFI